MESCIEPDGVRGVAGFGIRVTEGGEIITILNCVPGERIRIRGGQPSRPSRLLPSQDVQLRPTENFWRLVSSHCGSHHRDISYLVDAPSLCAVSGLFVSVNEERFVALCRAVLDVALAVGISIKAHFTH